MLFKKILLLFLIVLIGIQFIRPRRNVSGPASATDPIYNYRVPGNVMAIFKTSCYDCHSNNTHYPWYANIQPVGWLLAKHIRDGKAALNFNEFGSYSARRQLSKWKEIKNSMKDGSMPLWSYTLLHSDARLSKQGKVLVVNWINHITDSLAHN